MKFEFTPEDFKSYYKRFEDMDDNYIEQQWQLVLSVVPDLDLPYDPENNIFMEKIYYYSALCHILTMGEDGMFGPVDSATTGSVSVSYKLREPKTFLEEYWTSTGCGRYVYLIIKKYALGPRLYL